MSVPARKLQERADKVPASNDPIDPERREALLWLRKQLVWQNWLEDLRGGDPPRALRAVETSRGGAATPR